MVRSTITKGPQIRLALVALLLAVVLIGPTIAPGAADAAGRFGAEGNCDTNVSHRTLQEGNTGTSVKHLQCLLNQKGYNLAVDGDFGPKTDAAVRDFQRQNGLAVDGIVGEITWDALHPDVGFPGKPKPR